MSAYAFELSGASPANKVGPVDATPLQDVYLPGNPGLISEACPASERRFAATFSRLADIQNFDPVSRLRGGEIYVDSSGVNFAVRKFYGTQTLLTTRDVLVDGARYAAGSIFGAETVFGWDSRDCPRDIGVHEAGELRGIGLERMSLFGIPVPERRVTRKYRADATASQIAFMKTVETGGLFAIAQSAVDFLATQPGQTLKSAIR